VALAYLGCGTDPEPTDPFADLRERFGLATLGPVIFPVDNQPNAERAALGRLLFYDPILGGEQDVSCGTCHHPDFGFSDGRQFSAGVSGAGLGPGRTLSQSAISGDPIPETPRNSQTVLNAAHTIGLDGVPAADAPMFWDGRAAGLEEQALWPISTRAEMRGDAFPGTSAEAAVVAVDSILARLRAIPEYIQLFRGAFPSEAADFDAGSRAELVDASTLGRAIAAYERALVSGNSPYDRFVNGDDNALTETQKHGLEVFFTTGHCSVCHSDPTFHSFGFLVTGTPQAGIGKDVIVGDDTGREEHTRNPADRYAFKVPLLRNVELTAPYMHAGAFTTLEEVVRFYNAGAQPRHPGITDEMIEASVRTPLGLTDGEIDALVAFLRSLTDPGTGTIDPDLLSVPAAVPSGLTPVFGVGQP
jgi:cytochrome c peroxidase